jgi:hypothetical protein
MTDDMFGNVHWNMTAQMIEYTEDQLADLMLQM